MIDVIIWIIGYVAAFYSPEVGKWVLKLLRRNKSLNTQKGLGF